MAGSNYRRATKKHPTRIVHNDGDILEGFMLIPVGMDFVGKLTEAAGFLPFELADGEETFINLSSVKRITDMEDKDAIEAERAAKAAAEEKARQEAEAQRNRNPNKKKKKTSSRTIEEYDALEVLGLGEFATREDVQAAYRRMVKLYHPDRLRGLGVEASKIAYAEHRLADINNAYRVLNKDAA